MERSGWVGKRVRFKNGRQLDLGTVIRVHEAERCEGTRGRTVSGHGVNVETRGDDGEYRVFYAEVLEVVPDAEATRP